MDIAFFTPEFSRDLPNPVERMFTGNSMHWECYRDWSERRAFARQQFEAHVQAARTNTLSGISYQDEDALVYISVIDPEPKYLNLCLSATGSKVFVFINEWLEWITNISVAGEKLHPFKREALQGVLPKLACVPDVPTILAGTDWEGTERRWYQS
ncbi:MAG TPA: hypothetical protein DEV81_20850 [Cyanobacteria bacterium UBA11049]|nr:hypothetical protein [Cyanobacteria bacterium UBA11049]